MCADMTSHIEIVLRWAQGMTKPLLAILLLLPSLVLVGCDFEQVVHSQIDRNSKTVILWHEAVYDDLQDKLRQQGGWPY